MSEPRYPVSRWVEADAGDVTDRELGELLRAAGEPEPLSKRELAMVALRLDGEQPRGNSAVRYAILLAVGMLSGTGVAVAGFGVARLVERAQSQRLVDVPAAKPRASAPRVVARAESRAVPRASAELAPPAPREPAPVALPERNEHAPSSATLARETQLLAPALAALRRDGAPERALSLLDAYAREFPNGALGLEAASARVDTLLALGRSSEALALLDRLPLRRMARKKELHVIAAELRAKTDPARAIADYGKALSLGLTGALEERALYGVAGSRLRSGDTAGARRDLAAYLQRFPNGRFAGEARARLDATP